MCNHNSTNSSNQNNQKRTGTRLSDGKEAHAQDHQKWSRRNFLASSGLATLGSLFSLGSSPLKAMASSPLLDALGSTENDRVLVIINLDGGNDGLNTIVPRGNSTYYNLRPNIAIQEADMFALDTNYGMPNYMSDLQGLWGDGKMGIVHSVAYPDQNYSHFRSTDIWMSASESEEFFDTGWIGRYLDYRFPAYGVAPANYPIGMQIGNKSNLMFLGGENNMGLTINNPTEFYQIAQSGELYSTTNVPECAYGDELKFARQTANNTVRYAETIQEAYNRTTSYANYPSNELAFQLDIVSRLIKGSLGTKIYLVHLGGFDTHANQANDHQTLLTELSSAIKAFQDDLTASGRSEEVLTMTVSEFGRTVGENGSNGTDHGQAAPLFLFGDTSNLTGGLKGTFGALSNVPYEDQSYTTDFRSIYSSILKDWFCLDPVIVNSLLSGEFDLVPDLISPCDSTYSSSDHAVLLGHNPDRNNLDTMLIKYAILARGTVRVQILNTAGQPLVTLVNEVQAANSYTIPFKPGDHGLLGQEYIYRVEAGGKAYSRKIRFWV